MKNLTIHTNNYLHLATTILALVLLLSSCSKRTVENGKYVYAGGMYYLVEGKNISLYDDEVKKYTTTYTYKNGKLTFEDDDDINTFTIVEDNIMISEPYEIGNIPDSDRFSATCFGSIDGSLSVKFYKSGRFRKEINILGIRIENFDGRYTRNGNLITINYDNGGYNNYYVKDGLLCEAYVLDK